MSEESTSKLRAEIWEALTDASYIAEQQEEFYRKEAGGGFFSGPNPRCIEKALEYKRRGELLWAIADVLHYGEDDELAGRLATLVGDYLEARS